MHRLALCLAVDGLRTSALGTYGNTTYPTPELDRLAARSTVYDECYAHGAELEDFYGRFFNERLLATIAERRLASTLITDEPRVAEWADARGFPEVVLVESPAPQSSAAEVAQTQIARLLAAACVLILDDQSTAERLVWIHARGYRGPWDAPFEFREQLCEEGDPPPTRDVRPPSDALVADPDEALGSRIAYAAQTAVLDECLGAMLDEVRRELLATSQLTTLLVGVRGFALGEHGRVGADVRSTYGELTHLPCLWSDGETSLGASRCNWLAQPQELGQRLLAWTERATVAASRLEQAVSCGPRGELALRTREWMLRVPPDAGGEDLGAASGETKADDTRTPQLFVRPDDRWEFNDVASLRPAEVEEFLASLAAESAAAHGANVAR
jgi:hypothetical protein